MQNTFVVVDRNPCLAPQRGSDRGNDSLKHCFGCGRSVPDTFFSVTSSLAASKSSSASSHQYYSTHSSGSDTSTTDEVMPQESTEPEDLQELPQKAWLRDMQPQPVCCK